MERVSDLELIDRLNSLPKVVFTLSDLEKALPIQPKSLRTGVSRLKRKGVLQRVGQGLYGVYGKTVIPEQVAGQLYYPSYLSLKTVLSKVGVINQIPQQVYCVTPNKSYRTKISGTPIVYRQIRKDLFFGYYLDKGVPVAYPEKALLDLLYFISYGKETLSFDELYLKGLDKKRWNEFKKAYPDRIRVFAGNELFS